MSYLTDNVYRALERLRSGAPFANAWQAHTGRPVCTCAVDIRFIDYKPFERARVVAAVEIEPGVDNLGPVRFQVFAHVHADLAQARVEAAQGRRNGFFACAGPPLHLDESLAATLWTLPNAPNLAELGLLWRPTGICALLPEQARHGVADVDCSAPTLLRYVPLKRALLHWHHPVTGYTYYAKLFDCAGAVVHAANYQAIWQAVRRGALNFSVPEPIAFHTDFATLLMGKVYGRELTADLVSTDNKVFGDVGRAVAELHRSRVVPRQVWTAEQERIDLQRHMAGVARALPTIAQRLDALLARIRALQSTLSFDVTAPIHANLCGDQVLVDDAGRIGIVDWDDLALGDPLFDVGRLIAHLIHVGRQEHIDHLLIRERIAALLHGYRALSDSPVDTDRLAWQVAVALLLRAKISAVRVLELDWPQNFAAALDDAARVLDDSAYFYPVAPPVTGRHSLTAVVR